MGKAEDAVVEALRSEAGAAGDLVLSGYCTMVLRDRDLYPAERQAMPSYGSSIEDARSAVTAALINAAAQVQRGER